MVERSFVRRVVVYALLAAVGLCAALPRPGAAQSPVVRRAPVLARSASVALDAEVFGEREEVAVVLELEVTVTGEVQAARVLEGAGEPFDSAASEAGLRLSFQPALIDGEPRPARIRFRYVMPRPEASPEPEATPVTEADPVTEPDPATEAGSTALDTAPRALPDPPELTAPVLPPLASAEPTYRARAVADPIRELTRHDVDRAEVRRQAGAHGDPIRAVEILPGVSTPPGSTALVLRGAHPLDSQVMLEGAPVPSLDHVGGYTSFFNGRLLDRVELYPSNYSVRYGRALGGIVEVTVRDDYADGPHGGLEINVIDANADLQVGSPEVQGAVAFRRSWVDAIYGAVLGDEHTVTAPVYYDYQGILRYTPSRDDTFRLLVYGSYDDIALSYDQPGRDPDIQGAIYNQTQFHRGQVEWRHRYSSTLRHDIRVMAGHVAYDQQIGRLLSVRDEGLEISSRGELTAVVDPRVTLRLGYDFWGHHVNARYVGPPAPAPEGDPAGFAFDDPQVQFSAETLIARSAVYVESTLQPVDAWTLVPGVRVDYLGEIDEWTIEPRLSSHVAITPGTLFRAGVGLFAQPPQIGRTFERFGNPDLGPERALTSSVGLRQDIAGMVRVSVDGYLRYSFDRIVSTADGSAPYLVNEGIGRAYGGEVSARWIGDHERRWIWDACPAATDTRQGTVCAGPVFVRTEGSGPVSFELTIPGELSGRVLVSGVVCTGVEPASTPELGCPGAGRGEEERVMFLVSTSKTARNRHPDLAADPRLDDHLWIEGDGCADPRTLRWPADHPATLSWSLESAREEGEAGEREELLVSHAATHGELDRYYSIVAAESPGALEVAYRSPSDVPPEGLSVRFVLVVRDDRGGVSWIQRSLCVMGQ